MTDDQNVFTDMSPRKWHVFKAETAQGLAEILNGIIMPHGVHFVFAERGRFYAYVTGDLRVKEIPIKAGKTKRTKKTVTKKIKG